MMIELLDILKTMQQQIEAGNTTLTPGLKEGVKIVQDYITNSRVELEYSADVGNWKPVPINTDLKKLLDIGFNVRKKKH